MTESESGIYLSQPFFGSCSIRRQSYQYYADLFGESKKTVKTAMDKLEQLQVIRREFRTVSYGDGLVSNNVMYVELIPDTLYRLTFPENIPAMNGENISYAGRADDKTGGSLPTNSDAPMEILGGRSIPDGRQVLTKRNTGGARLLHAWPEARPPTPPDNGYRKQKETGRPSHGRQGRPRPYGTGSLPPSPATACLRKISGSACKKR